MSIFTHILSSRKTGGNLPRVYGGKSEGLFLGKIGRRKGISWKACGFEDAAGDFRICAGSGRSRNSLTFTIASQGFLHFEWV